MTNENILRIAMAQSAIDCNCAPQDFMSAENVVTLSRPHEDARKYLELPNACDLVSYGNNVVANVGAEWMEPVRGFIDRYPAEHCFETPNLHILNDTLQAGGLRVCFMAEYFLPDISRVKLLPCAYTLQRLSHDSFASLYLPEWGNALCEKRKELDLLGFGAYDGSRLIGLAGASADCAGMWQIGIDVLPAYRRQGIAAALTSRLALEIIDYGKVPFYCAAWSNIRSVRNAVKCGFSPAWVELTAKPFPFIDALNGIERP